MIISLPYSGRREHRKLRVKISFLQGELCGAIALTRNEKDSSKNGICTSVLHNDGSFLIATRGNKTVQENMNAHDVT